ncbi:MAG: hypothetical protein Q9182_003241 [Xanthomendoza sp. 2 TL-2023]
MGIPHLAGHLQPYAIHTTLGQKTIHFNIDVDKAPEYTLNLIIDGPALAYHIYYRLAHRSGASNPFDAIPSYQQIAARDAGGVVLTGDSDMLVYDIGDEGAVLFFSGLEMQDDDDDDDESGGTLLRGTVYNTQAIATRFAMPNLQRLAYEIKTDPTVSFTEAKRRTRLPAADESHWQAFRAEYLIPTNPSPPITSLAHHHHHPFLDPRLSELIHQLSSPNEKNDDATIYLPFLLDDPARASAWNASAELRHTLYDLLASSCLSRPVRSVTEVSRKGHRIICCPVPVTVNTSDNNTPRLLALLHALNTSPFLHPPRSAISDGVLSWHDIHLRAQTEAMLYVLRMVRQGVAYLRMRGASTGAEEDEGVLGEVARVLVGLLGVEAWRGFDGEVEKVVREGVGD